MSATNSIPPPSIYYDASKKDFYILDKAGRWISITATNVKCHLKVAGVSSRSAYGAIASPIDEEMVRIQTENSVDYASPLAGYDAGLVMINNRPILVTESPVVLEPADGEWPTIASILERMFNDPDGDQRPYLYGWLHVAVSGMQVRRWQPGQVCVLAGPVNCGKSLLQALITKLLGGRSANPYLFVAGKTEFNADLFRAEHLMIEDNAESSDMRVRRHTGAIFKGVAVNHEHHFHKKGLTGLTLTPNWRMTVSVNDEPERLQVVPPVDDDIGDKMMLFQVRPGVMPMATSTAEERERFMQQLESELPAFLKFLLEYRIPEELRCTRFGITHFHHPELLQALNGLSQQSRLLELIDSSLHPYCGVNVLFEGTAAELERRLYEGNNAIAQQARNLFSFNNACGTFLGRLVREMPDRVTRLGRSRYRIMAPSNTQHS